MKSIFLILFLFPQTTFSQHTILWSIKRSENPHISYLLGSYHQMGNSFIDSLTKIKELLIGSDLAIFESIEKKDSIAVYLNKRWDDYSFKKYLKRKDVSFLEKISQGWSVPLNKLTPLLLVIKLQQTYFETFCGSIKPQDKWKHFDQYIQYLAQENNVPVFGFEIDTMMFQNLHATATTKDWNAMEKEIHKWVLNLKRGRNKKKYCNNAYEYMQFSFDYKLEQECGESAILKSRNQRWLTLLPKLLEEKNCFITVGLLHLYGKCGLIMQLKNSGYTVEPVFNLK